MNSLCKIIFIFAIVANVYTMDKSYPIISQETDFFFGKLDEKSKRTGSCFIAINDPYLWLIGIPLSTLEGKSRTYAAKFSEESKADIKQMFQRNCADNSIIKINDEILSVTDIADLSGKHARIINSIKK